jgi:hypothetical protein
MGNVRSSVLALGFVIACGGAKDDAPLAIAGSGGASGETVAGSAADAGHDAPTAGRAGSAGVARDAGHGGMATSAAGGGGSSGSAGRAGSGGASGSAAGAGGSAGAAAGSGGAFTPPSGASRCADSQLLFCDGFEGASIDDGAWQAMQTKPALDTLHVARGSKALHMHTTATGASGLTATKFFANTSGHYYGRLFVYFDALPTSPQWAHWTIVGANPKTGEGEIRVGGQYDGKINRWGVGTDHGPTGDWTNLDGDPAGAVKSVPLQQWHCVEWLHDWDKDITKLYIDGEEHPSLDTTADVKHQTNPTVKFELPELSSVWVGFWNYDQKKPVTPSAFDVWIDEVAFDDERIGCDG